MAGENILETFASRIELCTLLFAKLPTYDLSIVFHSSNRFATRTSLLYKSDISRRFSAIVTTLLLNLRSSQSSPSAQFSITMLTMQKLHSNLSNSRLDQHNYFVDTAVVCVSFFLVYFLKVQPTSLYSALSYDTISSTKTP